MANKINKLFLQQLSAEFAATALLLMLGIGSCIMDRLTNLSGSPSIVLLFGWALAVLLGVSASLGVSGAHLNPAVSFAFALSGDLPWYKLPAYCAAQIFGGFCGAAMSYVVYSEALDRMDNGVRHVLGVNGTASLFATYPLASVSTSSGLINEIFATAILLFCIMAFIDKKNLNLPLYLLPIMVGFLILCINCSYCYNSGCAMNPARDLGPRLFTLVAGWGVGVFSHRNWWWFWVPIVGPMLGAPIGLFAYKFSFNFVNYSNCLHDKQSSSHHTSKKKANGSAHGDSSPPVCIFCNSIEAKNDEHQF